MTRRKQRIVDDCRRLRKAADQLALEIGDYAELSLREERSAARCREVLLQQGFRLERRFAQMPTAFVAAWGRGRPVIGLLAEYDALPDCGPRGKGPGHGCGHNLLGAGSVFAAIAAARALERERRRGTVRLFGCPAEETLVGKVYMARDGAFEGLDACLAWHPGAANQAHNGSGSAMDTFSFEFFGKTAHAAGDPHNGRSALDAVEIMNVAINFLREHMPLSNRLHYIISDGGKAPNVVPAYARSWYFIRGQNRKEVEALRKRVIKCARGAALATETRLKHHILTGCYDRLANDALASALQANLKAVGPPRFTKADRDYAKSLGLTGELDAKIGEISTARGAGSSEEANVSWLAPLTVLNTACCAKGTPGHHYLLTAQSTHSIGLRGLHVAIPVLALTAYDLFTRPKLLATVKREFRRRTKDFTYDPLIPDGQPPPVADVIPPG